MNDRLIDALFSVSSRIREIRMEMDKLAGDGSDSDEVDPATPTSRPGSAPIFARKEECATLRPSSGDTNNGQSDRGHRPLQCNVTMPGARLN